MQRIQSIKYTLVVQSRLVPNVDDTHLAMLIAGGPAVVEANVNDLKESTLSALVAELPSLPSETEWVEFKQNNSNPQEIGEYISALANAAALHGRECG